MLFLGRKRGYNRELIPPMGLIPYFFIKKNE
jgi:hypothetical protein